MQLANFVTGNRNNQDAITMAHRLTLTSGEIRRLPGSFREIVVQSGCVWVSLEGQDIVLEAGENLRLDSAKDFAVVQAMCNPATFTLSRH